MTEENNFLLNENIEIIEKNAFINKNIINLEIPTNIKRIGENAFKDNSIVSLTLNHGLETIENNAFYNNDLTHATIPSSVTNIGKDAFEKNPLKQVTFLHQKKNYTINECAFPSDTILYFENIFTCPLQATYYKCSYKDPITGNICYFNLSDRYFTYKEITNRLHQKFKNIIRQVVRYYLNNHYCPEEIIDTITEMTIKEAYLDKVKIIEILLKNEEFIISKAFEIDLLGIGKKHLKKIFENLRKLKIEEQQKEIIEPQAFMNLPTIPTNKKTSIIEYFVLIKNELVDLPDSMCIEINQELSLIKNEYLELKNPLHLSSDIDLIYRLEKILISIKNYKNNQNQIILQEIIEISLKPIMTIEDYKKIVYQIYNFENNIEEIEDLETIITITQNFTHTIKTALTQNIITEEILNNTMNEKYKKLIRQRKEKNIWKQ